MKTPRAGQALVRAIGLSRSDPAVQRTVMEALKSVPWDKVGAEPRKIAAAMVRAIVLPGEGEAPAPARRARRGGRRARRDRSRRVPGDAARAPARCAVAGAGGGGCRAILAFAQP